MKNINKFYTALITMTFGFSLIGNVGADDLDLFLTDNSDSGDNSFYKEDGSLVIIRGAKDSGYIIEDGEVKTYVVPSDTEKTFIQDGPSGKLIVCDPAIGCY